MKQNILKLLSICCIPLTLVACGGGGSESASEPVVSVAPPETSAPPETTGTLVVSDSFDFRIDSTINLHVTELPSGPGVINIYYKHEYYDADSGTYYPDYTSLVGTWRPSTLTSFPVNFNQNWDGLLFVWVPETASGVELYKRYSKSELSNDLYLSL